MVTVLDRCGDCPAVVDDLGEWSCDVYGKACENVITCVEWEGDSPFATITHTTEGDLISR